MKATENENEIEGKIDEYKEWNIEKRKRERREKVT